MWESHTPERYHRVEGGAAWHRGGGLVVLEENVENGFAYTDDLTHGLPIFYGLYNALFRPTSWLPQDALQDCAATGLARVGRRACGAASPSNHGY